MPDTPPPVTPDDLPGATVHSCPLSSCSWTHVIPQPGPEEHPGVLADVFGWGVFAATATARRLHDTEETLRAHLGSHDLAAWVAEVVKLHDVMTAVAAELDEDGRIGRTLLTGAYPTNANVARAEYIKRIGHAIEGGSGG